MSMYALACIIYTCKVRQSVVAIRVKRLIFCSRGVKHNILGWSSGQVENWEVKNLDRGSEQ